VDKLLAIAPLEEVVAFALKVLVLDGVGVVFVVADMTGEIALKKSGVS
jgi:hypothetical protein